MVEEKKFSIYILQEVRSTKETEPYCITFIARKYCPFTLQENSFSELYNLLNCLDYERRYAVKTGSFRKFNAKWGAFIRRNNP